MADPIIARRAAKLNIEIEQGADFDVRVVWKDEDGNIVNITGYTARMHIRPTVQSSIILVDLATGGDGITLDGPAGAIDLHIDDAETEALVFKRGVYDLELEDTSGRVFRLLQGVVKLIPEVTR